MIKAPFNAHCVGHKDDESHQAQIYFSNKIYGSDFINMQHSETVMV